MTRTKRGDRAAIWTPCPDAIANSAVTRLAGELGLADYEDLLRFSLERPDRYWSGVLRHLGVWWSKPYTAYVDLTNGRPFPVWFPGGRLNWVDSALAWAAAPRSAATPAIIAEREDGTSTAVTYAQLPGLVRRFAAGLQSKGIGRGDRVGLLVPSGVEAVVSLLAISYLGGIAVPLFTGFGAESVISRLSSSGARALIIADGFRRRGRWLDLGRHARAVQQVLPGVSTVVVKRYEDREGSGSAAFADWDDLARTPDRIGQSAEQMDPNDPFMIIYTSGTTGAPKGTVHTHGGFPLKIAHDALVHFDIREGDVWFWPADMGWVVGSITVAGALLRGATVVCYDGAPDHPDPARVARIVERYDVTHLGASPTLIRGLAGSGAALPSNVRRSSLKVLITAGEVIDADHFVWYQQGFGGGVAPVINYTGGTEVSGALLASVVVRPIAPTEFNSGSPSIAVDVVDADGLPTTGGVGELVIREPFVGMTRGFWNDDERYIESYWSRYPDLWVHGDLAKRRTQQGGRWVSYSILGRSDDTLKIAGKRLGPSEVEAAALEVKPVLEAAAIGIDDSRKGQMLVLFVVCSAADITPSRSQALREELLEHIGSRLGRPFRPERIHIVPELPKTRNAKIMRRVVRQAYCGELTGDLSALENPEAVHAIRACFPPSKVGAGAAPLAPPRPV